MPEDLPFANSLLELGCHAASVASRDDEAHDEDGCVFCQRIVLLARIVHYGDQIRGRQIVERTADIASIR